MCADINECESNNGGCEQNCENNAGSYNCTCSNGYTLNNNGYNCTGKIMSSLIIYTEVTSICY